MQTKRTLAILSTTGLLLAVFAVAASDGLRGEDAKKPKLEPGFRALFNGKDLKGWHKNPEKIGHGTGGRWYVEDGAITGEQDPPGSGNGGILLTDAKFGDFEVIFETKPDWGVCSGFFLRSTGKGQCYQVMVDYHDNGNVGEIYREGLDGHTNRTLNIDGVYADKEKKILKGTVASLAEKNDRGQGSGKPKIKVESWAKLWKINAWNTVRARVKGNPPTITTWVNGKLISKYTSDKKFEGILQDRDSIAVQVHGGTGWPKGAKVRFRNIRIKEL